MGLPYLACRAGDNTQVVAQGAGGYFSIFQQRTGALNIRLGIVKPLFGFINLVVSQQVDSCWQRLL